MIILKVRTIIKWIKNSVSNFDKVKKLQVDNEVAED